MGSIVGTPYGTVFEINGRNLVRIYDNEEDDMDEVLQKLSNKDGSAVTAAADGDVGKVGGNKDFYDTNTAQKMDYGAIEEMKKSGVSGLYTSW